MPDRLVVEGLSKRFGGTEVLRNLDLVVEPGAVSAVLGPSGCGKTTLLRTIAGFESPDLGRILIGNKDVTDLPPEQRNVGIVPQEGALFAHLDVAGNVAFGLRRWAKSDRAARVAECLDMVGLSSYEKARPDELSGGQQQRVAVARALAPRPNILLLDEPFAALDANLRQRVRDDLAAAVRASGTTTMLVTHDRDEALSMADQVAVMMTGVIVQASSAADLYRHPVSSAVATFVGEATLVPGTRIGRTVTSELGVFEADGPDGQVFVVVRPEQVVLGPAVAENHPLDSSSAATVTASSFFGHDSLVELTLESGLRLTARVPGHRVPSLGLRTTVALDGVISVVPAT